MIIRRLSRSLVIAPLARRLAAAFVALGAAQNPEAPGDPLDRRLQEHLPGIGVGCG